MKTLLIASLVMLVGCVDFTPMSDGEAKAFQACLDKGWEPTFMAGSSSRRLECENNNEI